MNKLKRGQEIRILEWWEKIDLMLENNHANNPNKCKYYLNIQENLYSCITETITISRMLKICNSLVKEYARFYMYKRLRVFKIEENDCFQECNVLLWDILKKLVQDEESYPIFGVPFVYIYKTVVESRTMNMIRDFNRHKRILSCSNYFKKGQAIIRIDSIDRLKELQDFDIEDKTTYKAFENIEQKTDKMAKHSDIMLTNEAIVNEFTIKCNNAGIALTQRERIILLRMLELGKSYKTYSVRAFAELCSMNQTTMRRERKSLFEKINIVDIPNRLKSILTAS